MCRCVHPTIAQLAERETVEAKQLSLGHWFESGWSETFSNSNGVNYPGSRVHRRQAVILLQESTDHSVWSGIPLLYLQLLMINGLEIALAYEMSRTGERFPRNS